MTNAGSTPPGWYQADGDPPGTQRYWDGSSWVGDPQPIAPAAPAAPIAPPPGDAFAPPPGAGTFPPPPPGGFTPPGGPSTEFIPELGVTLANPGLRLVARFIDGLIVGIPLAILGVILGVSTFGFGGDFNFGALAISSIVGAAAYFAYEYLFLQSSGATPGKMIFKMKVIGEDGQPLTQSHAMNRAGVWGAVQLVGIVPILGGLVGFVFWIVCVVFLFSKPRHQDIPDLFAKTIVIQGS